MGCMAPGAVNKEYTPVKDAQDGYSFVYLFGWQEVAVKGQDVVYKDVIEPLESVSVSITKTDKEKVSEFGPAPEVRRATFVVVYLCLDSRALQDVGKVLESVSSC